MEERNSLAQRWFFVPEYFIMLHIPFYKNLQDDSHCFQACLKMLLKYTFPEEKYSYAELDALTSHGPGHWTWNTAGLLFLAKKGFEGVNIENFDYRQFAEFGKEYLRMIWTEDIFEAQKRHSDFEQERILAGKFMKQKRIRHIRRPTTFSEIEKYFREGYIVLVTLNALAFEEREGYSPHIILLTHIDRDSVTFHDPGLPPHAGRRVSRKLFQKALYSPYKEIASLIALRHKDLVKKQGIKEIEHATGGR